MDKLLRAGIIFAIGLFVIDVLIKGGDNNDTVLAVERNVNTGVSSSIDSGEHSTGQGDNWHSLNTENFI